MPGAHAAGADAGRRPSWKYHHIGIPTSVEQPGETYLARHRLFCTDHERNPFGIQWMRYEPECTLPEVVKTVAHVAFEVDDLDAALAGQQVLIAPNSPSEGVMVAFVLIDGAPVELLQYVNRPATEHTPTPQRQVLALTQVSGATAAIRSHGDAAMLEVARAANAVLRAAVARAGGRVVKSLGEGLLLAFPLERARDAVSALRAARAEASAVWRAFDAGCELHVTMTAGPVLTGDLGLVAELTADVWGLTVHRLFKERANGFVILPELESLLDAPPGPRRNA